MRGWFRTNFDSAGRNAFLPENAQPLRCLEYISQLRGAPPPLTRKGFSIEVVDEHVGIEKQNSHISLHPTGGDLAHLTGTQTKNFGTSTHRDLA